MSGYKNMWFGTQAEHLAYLLYACIEHGACGEREADDEGILAGWEHEARQGQYFAAAGLVASEVRSGSSHGPGS